MRSKLSVLQAAYQAEADIAGRAEYAWNRLSSACHHHAFELTPVNSEVLHMIELVSALSGRESDDL